MPGKEKNSAAAESKQSKKADKSKNKKPGFFQRVGKWFHDLRAECKKIVWPTRKQTINNSAIVLATIFVIGVFIWILDAIFNFGISTLISIVA